MPERNPLTGKKQRSTAQSSAPSTSGPLIATPPTTIGEFTDAIELPFNVPDHDPGSLLPSDIYDPSTSSAPRLSRDEADRRIADYGEMIAAQDVATAGYNFIASVFKTHTSYQKALGEGFSALRESLSTQRKQVSAATAVVDLSTERLKFARSVQLNQQATIKLTTETTKTGLTQERSDVEVSKLKNEIQGLKAQAQQALQKAQALELST